MLGTAESGQIGSRRTVQYPSFMYMYDGWWVMPYLISGEQWCLVRAPSLRYADWWFVCIHHAMSMFTIALVMGIWMCSSPRFSRSPDPRRGPVPTLLLLGYYLRSLENCAFDDTSIHNWCGRLFGLGCTAPVVPRWTVPGKYELQYPSA